MKKIYCKQVDPEFQNDNLFYSYFNKEKNKTMLDIYDPLYQNNIIIEGNKEFINYYPDHLEFLFKHLDDFVFDFENSSDNITTLVNWYFVKENGKKWSKKEVHKWREVYILLSNYTKDNEKKARLLALKLITGKIWREFVLRGCMQSEWQYGFCSDLIKSKDISYIEACYFNTGTEWLVFDNYLEYKRDNFSYSIYIEGYKKQDIADAIGCDVNNLVAYAYDDYITIKKATYKLLEA